MGKQKIYDRMTKDLPINSVVARDIVDDPIGDGSKSEVIRSLRDDPLAAMRSRDQLRSDAEREADRRNGRNTGEARYRAGREFQEYLSAEIGNIRAVDPTKEAVDGGRFPDLLSDKQSRAFSALRAARAALGEFDMSLIYDILGRRMSIREVAKARMMLSAREANYISRRFRDALDALAKLWGFA